MICFKKMSRCWKQMLWKVCMYVCSAHWGPLRQYIWRVRHEPRLQEDPRVWCLIIILMIRYNPGWTCDMIHVRNDPCKAATVADMKLAVGYTVLFTVLGEERTIESTFFFIYIYQYILCCFSLLHTLLVHYDWLDKLINIYIEYHRLYIGYQFKCLRVILNC